MAAHTAWNQGWAAGRQSLGVEAQQRQAQVQPPPAVGAAGWEGGVLGGL